jgi:ribose transport system permease protein
MFSWWQPQEWIPVNNQPELQSNPNPSLEVPRRKGLKNQNLQELLGLIGIYALLFIGLSLKSPYFLKPDNLINIMTAVSVIGFIAIAMTMVIVSGGLDLSVGSVVALTGVIVAQLSHIMPIGAAIAVAILVGVFVGAFNGFAITKIGINPLITTLGTLSIARGLAYVLSKGDTQSIDNEAFTFLGNGRLGPIPVQVIVLIVLALLAAWVMKSTVFGRSVYAIGGNAQASRLAGLPVLRLQMFVYILSGLSAAVGGMFLTSQLSAAAPESSAGLELSVIAAVILGGTSLTGGKGTIAGTMLGVMILGTLNNGLTLLNVSSNYQDIARGAVLLLAVALDQLRLRVGQK